MVLDRNQTTQPSQQQIADFAYDKSQKALAIARKLEVMRLAAIEPAISELVKATKQVNDSQITTPIKKELVSA